MTRCAEGVRYGMEDALFYRPNDPDECPFPHGVKSSGMRHRKGEPIHPVSERGQDAL